MDSVLVRVLVLISGIIAFAASALWLESVTGISLDTSYRVACAITCLGFIGWIGKDYPGEKWPAIALWSAAIVNLAIFFTPLVEREASRGELMIFALPDVIVVLIARIATYSVNNDNERAMRQQMFLGLLAAILFFATMAGAEIATG